jgi:hypothetical protein
VRDFHCLEPLAELVLKVHLLLAQQVILLAVVVQVRRVPLRHLLQPLLERDVAHSHRVVVVGLHRNSKGTAVRHAEHSANPAQLARNATQRHAIPQPEVQAEAAP